MNAFIRRQVMKIYQLVTGRRILDRFDELNRTQWLGRDELLALQRDKLHKLLIYAYHYVPYYRRIFDQVGFQPDEVLTDLVSLRKLPLLNRTIIRENFDDMLTSERQRRAHLSRSSTSGSTGRPLIFMQDTDSRDYFTANIHHHLTWGGWRFGQPHAYIGGSHFEVSKARSLRAHLMNWTLNRFTINAYVLSEESMRAFADRIRRQHVRFLYGYASSLYHFAKFVRQNNFDIQLKSVFSSAEVLYPHQRRFIEEAFGCKVLDRYAALELGELGAQCEFQTGLHVSMESVYIEILDDNGQPARLGEPGNIVVTKLNNYGMPFIRYSLADVASWYPVDTCPCGRAHSMLSIIEGRHNDMFRTHDGRVVWGGITNPLWSIEGIKQFQFVQKKYDLVIVRVVKDGGLQSDERNSVKKAIHTALGDNVKVEFEFPSEIPIEKSGKHRYQICEIDAEPFDNI
jgi:phenylacetate-CoA ligase